jgi:hypothetical protein
MKTPRLIGHSLSILICCLCFQAAPLFAQPGSLAGLVSDEGGKAVTGAFITANRETLPVATGRAFSAADGTFQIGGLPAGSYTVCVQFPSAGFVDTCEWQILPLRVDVKAGQATAGLKFKLQKGAILHVRLNDPGNLLQPSSTAIAKTAPRVLLGVQTARGLLHPATQVSKDATGTTHAVTVPFDTALSFTVVGSNVSLADEKGAAIGQAGLQGSNVPITIPSGTTPAPLTINVTGLKLP